MEEREIRRSIYWQGFGHLAIPSIYWEIDELGDLFVWRGVYLLATDHGDHLLLHINIKHAKAV